MKNIHFEWKYDEGELKRGIARFRVGGHSHEIPFDSYSTATRVHQLLLRAHSAGMRSGNHELEAERQRVADLLSIAA